VADIEASDEVTDNNLERIVNRAFRLISPDMQCVLTLFSEGASYEEIAEKMNLKNETYARRKKYLAKEALIEKVKEDPEYQEYLRFRN
jgi:predicted transcriptional regulator